MVHDLYWNQNANCTATVIKILSEIFNIKICEQVLDSAIGMHGAGNYGAQCGLVEGTLMFIGIYGKDKKYDDDEIINMCYEFAKIYEKKFGSLICRKLRPIGFTEDSSKHLCETLTIESVRTALDFIIKK